MKRLFLPMVLVTLGLMFHGCGDQPGTVTGPDAPSVVFQPSNAAGLVSDPVGDARDDPRTDPDPDLVAADVHCDVSTLVFEVAFDPPTFLPEGTYAGFQLDTDQDPGTGFPGVDLAGNDTGIMGLEYVLYVGDLGPSATLYRFVAPPNSFVQVDTYPVEVLPAGYRVLVPLTDFGGDDGAMNYKLTSQAVISPGSWTGVIDYMPDLGLPPGMAEACPRMLTIDIKPGSDPNSVNCHNPNALIPVAILGSDMFDVMLLDYTSVRFEGASEVHVNKKTGLPRRHLEDVNGDGYMDLVFHFLLTDTMLDCDSMEGWLQGTLLDGTVVVGMDAIRMVNKLLTPMP